MIAIDAQQRLWRGGGGQVGDEIDDLVLWLLPLAVLLDLARTYDASSAGFKRAQVSFLIGNTRAERAYAKAHFTFAEETRAPEFEISMGVPGMRRFARHM